MPKAVAVQTLPESLFLFQEFQTQNDQGALSTPGCALRAVSCLAPEEQEKCLCISASAFHLEEQFLHWEKLGIYCPFSPLWELFFAVVPEVLPEVSISAWYSLGFSPVLCHSLTRINPQVHLIALLCPNPALWQWLLIIPELSWMLMGEIICGMLSTTSIHCC